MIAWHGEPKLKAAALARLREHQRLDQFAQRVYWEAGRGCALGCLTHANRDAHAATERMFGIELRVAYWIEWVFEGLAAELAPWWAVASAEAIPDGADLSRCHHELAIWLLGPDSPSAAGNAHPSVRGAIARVRALHERAARGEAVGESEWLTARSTAQSAARSVAPASAAAESARSAAAESARSAAAESAWSAAWSAARSAAAPHRTAAAAWSAAWKAIADKSLELFRAAPIVSAPTAEQSCQDRVADSLRLLAGPIGT